MDSSGASGREADGYDWTFACEEIARGLAPVIEAFPDLAALDARVLKENRLRTVFHVPAERLPAAEIFAGGVLAKAYRYHKQWDRLRFRLLPSRAESEWRALERFGELGIPTARPLAMARRRSGFWPVGGGLIATFLAGTVTLAERLIALSRPGECDAPPRVTPAGEALLVRAGELVRRVQDAGIWHRDLHVGNILVDPEGDRLYLVDLHTCVFLRRLASWQRRGGIVKMLHSLGLVLDREDLGAFLRGAAGEDANLAHYLRAIARAHALRHRSRSKRCFVESSAFTVERRGGTRIFRRRDWCDGAALASWWPSSPPPDAGVAKEARRSWVAAVRDPDGEAVCVKHRTLGLAESLASLLASHRLRRAYAAGHAFAVRGLETPRVLALHEARRLGCVREAWLVTEWAGEARRLDVFLREEYWHRRRLRGADARRKHALAHRAGEFLARLHGAGVATHDMAPQNVVVGAGEVLRLVDLDDVRFVRRVSVRRRLRNLIQLGNVSEGHVSTADRMRALASYDERAPDARFLAARNVRRLRVGILREQERVLSRLLRRDFAGSTDFRCEGSNSASSRSGHPLREGLER